MHLPSAPSLPPLPLGGSSPGTIGLRLRPCDINAESVQGWKAASPCRKGLRRSGRRPSRIQLPTPLQLEFQTIVWILTMNGRGDGAKDSPTPSCTQRRCSASRSLPTGMLPQQSTALDYKIYQPIDSVNVNLKTCVRSMGQVAASVSGNRRVPHRSPAHCGTVSTLQASTCHCACSKSCCADNP